jgi:class 3 adenylate cyclase
LLRAELRPVVAELAADYRGFFATLPSPIGWWVGAWGSPGDGLLLEFASVVDAVRCAVEVQREMAERNADVPPDSRIEFRMGINLGDIIKDGRDIYGDGVNVAARL